MNKLTAKKEPKIHFESSDISAPCNFKEDPGFLNDIKVSNFHSKFLFNFLEELSLLSNIKNSISILNVSRNEILPIGVIRNNKFRFQKNNDEIEVHNEFCNNLERSRGSLNNSYVNENDFIKIFFLIIIFYNSTGQSLTAFFRNYWMKGYPLSFLIELRKGWMPATLWLMITREHLMQWNI